MTPVMHFGGGKSASEAQQQEIAELMPPQLVPNGEWKGQAHVAKIRVWADDEFRAQNIHWQHAFDEQLQYANAVLAPMVGLRLEAEYRAWSRHAPGATLGESLEALARQDAGGDVFSVVGLTSSLSLVSATFDELGLASMPGRYIMLRGYAEVGERKAFDEMFKKVPADERANAVEGRRRHKMAAVFLHELAHNLGAPHDPEDDTIMSAHYSTHSASFSDRARDIMLATLAARLGRATEPRPTVTASQSHHAKIIVGVNAQGQAIIGGRIVDDDTLDGLFRLSYGDDHDTEVIVTSEPGAPHDASVRVFDLAKAAGLHRLSMSTAAASTPP
jgi:biopolymer transport protein ExbD